MQNNGHYAVKGHSMTPMESLYSGGACFPPTWFWLDVGLWESSVQM